MKILVGDVLDMLRSMPTASFDACFSDPPYGLEFLGLDWDRVLPPAAVWVELARVLKPGSNTLIFGGTRTFHRLAVALEDAGFFVADTLSWLHSQGLPKSQALLKPAWEPILLARSPGKTVRPLNIAGCRLPNAGGSSKRSGEASADRRYTDRGTTNFAMKPGPRGGDERGRFPANVVLDEQAAADLDAQAGVRKSGAMRSGKSRARDDGFSGNWGGVGTKDDIAASAGGASRFFYCPKVKSGRIHPTQKPEPLTEWLARLLLVPEGRLLVPYAGVGSEVAGAKAAGWSDVVGIEMNGDYAALAQSRVG